MKLFRAWKCWVALILLLGLVGASGCTQFKDRSQKRPAWLPTKVAILPFEKVDSTPGTFQVVSPLSGAVFSSRNSADEHIGIKVLDASLSKWMHESTRLQLTPASEAAPVFRQMQRDNMELPLNQVIAKVGKELEVDGVIIGYLYRFARRVGTPYSADTPASVALDITMVRCSDGALIWKNSFDERQVSLTENMFTLENYFKYGLTWYTAEEFAVLGLNEAMKRFPWTDK